MEVKVSAAPGPKYNSTSSLYIDSTITKPCIDEIIFCVSIVIHDRIKEGESEVTEPLCELGPGALGAVSLVYRLAHCPLRVAVRKRPKNVFSAS